MRGYLERVSKRDRLEGSGNGVSVDSPRWTGAEISVGSTVDVMSVMSEMKRAISLRALSFRVCSPMIPSNSAELKARWTAAQDWRAKNVMLLRPRKDSTTFTMFSTQTCRKDLITSLDVLGLMAGRQSSLIA